MCLALQNPALHPSCPFVSASVVLKFSNTQYWNWELASRESEISNRISSAFASGGCLCLEMEGAPSRGCIYQSEGKDLETCKTGVREGDLQGQCELEVRKACRCLYLESGDSGVGGLSHPRKMSCQALSTARRLCLGWLLPAS